MISKMNFERFIETYSDSNDDSRIGCVGSIISTSLENAELDEDITKDKKSSTQSGVSILETGQDKIQRDYCKNATFCQIKNWKDILDGWSIRSNERF